MEKIPKKENYLDMFQIFQIRKQKLFFSIVLYLHQFHSPTHLPLLSNRNPLSHLLPTFDVTVED